MLKASTNGSRTENTIRNSLFAIMTRIVIILFNFITRIVFVRTLGDQYTGVLGLFTEILSMLAIAELGVGTAITRGLYKPIKEKDNYRIAQYMSFIRKAYHIIAASIIILGLLVIPFFPYILKDIPDVKESIYLIYALYLINTSVSYLFIYNGTLLTASQKHYLVNLVQSAISVVKCAVNISLLLIFRNFLLYLVIEIGCNLLQNILITNVAKKDMTEVYRYKDAELDKETKHSLFNDLRALFYYKISGAILKGTDSIIISTFIGVSTVGLYSNYTLLSNQMYYMIHQVFGSATPSIGNLSVEKKGEEQYVVYEKLMFFAFALYCISGSVFFNCAQPLIELAYGKTRVLSLSFLAVLSIEYYVRGMMGPVSSFRDANGLFVQGKYRPLIMAFMNIVISVLLVKPLGLVGVVLGTVLSRAMTQLWFDIYILNKLIFKRSYTEVFGKYLLYLVISVVCTAIPLGCMSIFSINSVLLRLIVSVILSLVVCIGLIVLLFHRSAEYKSIKRIVLGFSKKILAKGRA